MIRRVLQVSGIGQMFTQFQTRQAAIEGVTGTEPLGALWRRVRDRS
jgi:hypothetical protein